MQGLNKTLMELHVMLVTAERDIKVAPKATKYVLMVQKGKGFKKHGKGNKITKSNGKGAIQTRSAITIMAMVTGRGIVPSTSRTRRMEL